MWGVRASFQAANCHIDVRKLSQVWTAFSLDANSLLLN